jgi:hypothetical protein
MVVGLLCVNVILSGVVLAVAIKSLKLKQDRFGALAKDQQSLLAQVLATQGSLEMRSRQLLGLQQKTDAQLDPQASHWVLAKGEVTKFFEPGKITRVTDEGEKSETEYKYSETGEVECVTRVEGVLRSSIVFSSYGAPLRGTVYAEDGTPAEEFTYDRLGQVEAKQEA